MSTNILLYLIIHGLQNCQHIAPQTSLFDIIRKTLFDGLAQANSTACIFSTF
jgi:hypothetical protein